jgi:hypothetical protein
MLEFLPGDIVAEARPGLVWKVIAYNAGHEVAICEQIGAGRCVIRALPAKDLQLTEPPS